MHRTSYGRAEVLTVARANPYLQKNKHFQRWSIGDCDTRKMIVRFRSELQTSFEFLLEYGLGYHPLL